jgi:hypothetical protein
MFASVRRRKDNYRQQMPLDIGQIRSGTVLGDVRGGLKNARRRPLRIFYSLGRVDFSV